MKRIHTEARKANRGKRGDSPEKGLDIVKMKVPEVEYSNKMVVRSIIKNYSLVHPKNGKPAFLRRNSLIKKDQ